MKNVNRWATTILCIIVIQAHSQNVGINNANPLGKLTINTPAANGNLPTLLLIDSANSNAGGAVLQFRNGIDKRMGLQSHFGTAANGTDSYLTFSYDGFYTMRLRGDGILSLGTAFPYLAKAGLEVNKKVGKVVAAFGTNEAGVAIESNVPGIHFNNYNFDGSRKTMVAGYGGGVEFNYLTGTLTLYNSTGTAAAGAALATAGNKMFINKNGNVGIGVPDPQSLLHINGGVKINNNNFLEFGYGLTKEENAGKIGYALFTPNTLDIVGAGTGYGDRRIRFWAEEATEFTGNADVFGSLKVRGLQSTSSKRPVFADSAGNLVAGSEIQYIAINATDFFQWMQNPATTSYKTIDDPGATTCYFGSAGATGNGYFYMPLEIPVGAKVVSVQGNYLSKTPENGSPGSVTAKLGVSFFEQGVDVTLGAFSYKYSVLTFSDPAITTPTWKITGGGLNIKSLIKTNLAGLYTRTTTPVTVVVYGNTGSSDFRLNSAWPSNGGLSFHSLIIGYRL